MIAEKFEDVSAVMDECKSSVGEYLNRGTEQISHMIDDRPTQSLLITCLAGFGVGLVLSKLFVSEKPVRSSVDRQTAERFGRQLLDRVEHAMPNILRERFMK
jgi:hypothetical protein